MRDGRQPPGVFFAFELVGMAVDEIREKLGNEGQDLYNKDLLKKIHSHTLDIKWNFDKG